MVRLEDVTIDDYIEAAVKVGRPCTIAFINRKLRLPKPFDTQFIRDAIVGVGVRRRGPASVRRDAGPQPDAELQVQKKEGSAVFPVRAPNSLLASE